MFYIPADYVDTPFKIVLGIPLFLSFIFLFLTKNKVNITKGILLFVGLILSTQITLMITEEPLVHIDRIDFFSLPFLYALGVVLCLQKEKLIKSISLTIMAGCIFYGSLQDIRCQKAWYFQRQAELNIYDEAIYQVKTHPDFDAKKKYGLVTIGKPRPFHDAYDRKYNPHFRSYFQRGMVLEEQMKVLFDFYEKDSYLKRSKYAPKLPDQVKTYFSDKKPFPAPHSILIQDDVIYILFDYTKVK